jgi:hypothetical protein
MALPMQCHGCEYLRECYAKHANSSFDPEAVLGYSMVDCVDAVTKGGAT